MAPSESRRRGAERRPGDYSGRHSVWEGCPVSDYAERLGMTPPRKDIRVEAKSAEVRMGRYAARVPAGTREEVRAKLRRLLARGARDGGRRGVGVGVGVGASACAATATVGPFRAWRLVDAAGFAAMFGGPFVADDKGKRLDPAEWRAKLEQRRPELVPLFDRLRARRDSVFSHADTRARVSNVTNTHKMFRGREPDDPIDLRTYDSGAADELLAPEKLEAAVALAGLFSERMVELGAMRVRELG